MDKLIQTIQDEINNLMKSKSAKASDAQLLHFEKLSKWRRSDENKKQFSERGLHGSKFTFEQAEEIRNKFYYQNVYANRLAKEYNVSETNLRQLLKNQSYKVDDWDYPDYEEQKEKNFYVNERIAEKIQFIKDGYGVTNFCEYFQCEVTTYYGLVKKYKLTTPKRTGSVRAKFLKKDLAD